MSLLRGPWSPPGVSNGNNRKNDDPLMVVPSVNVPYGAAAQKNPKLMTLPLTLTMTLPLTQTTAQTLWRNWFVFFAINPSCEYF